MSEAIPVFWLEETFSAARSLRRYAADGARCPARPGSWPHNGRYDLDEVPYRRDDRQIVRAAIPPPPTGQVKPVGWEHAAWPSQCDFCGMSFAYDDYYQVQIEPLYRIAGSDLLTTLTDAPVGAMWDAVWMPDNYRGPDGIALVVKTPGGEWHVDAQASNCTRPGEPHQCWVRTGDPRQGQVHVDKSGVTCAAGGGSILIGGYHGFLHDSKLVLA